MPFNNLLFNIKDNIATVTLNRPEKMNSLDEELINNISSVFKDIKNDQNIKAVILTGSNQNFCSGLYLDYLRKIADFSFEDNLKDSFLFRDMLLSIYDCPKPVIAKVSGYALAGGCGIATCCDFIIADDTAKFGYTEVRIGFIPAIVSVFLLKRVSETHARDLLLTSRIINAEDAFSISLINKVVSPDVLEKNVNELCDLLVKNPSGSMSLTKDLLRTVPYLGMNDAFGYTCELNAKTRMTEECKEGISNFLNKSKK